MVRNMIRIELLKQNSVFSVQKALKRSKRECARVGIGNGGVRRLLQISRGEMIGIWTSVKL